MINYNKLYENYIDKQLLELEKKGSQFSKQWLIDIKKELLIRNFNSNFNDTLDNIALEICDETINFINTGTISGLSVGIFLPEINYKLNLYGGYQDYSFTNKISETTTFDIASITKLFTLLLTFKLEELGLLDLNKKVSKINPEYKLEDFTFNDLIKMLGLIQTPTRIDTCDNIKANQILKKIKITDHNKKQNTYTDMGLIILSKTIEKIINKHFYKPITFDQIMERYLLKPLGLNNTTFYPLTNVAGNGRKDTLPHDAKARILGPIGSAGLFSTSNDLSNLFYKLYHSNYLNNNHLEKLFKKTIKHNSLGYAGINLKHKQGISKSFAPKEYSKQVYAHQGWTGSVIINDSLNQIHNNFLISSIKEGEKNKPTLFMRYYNEYQMNIVKKTLELLIIKKMYNYYAGFDNKIDKVIHLD